MRESSFIDWIRSQSGFDAARVPVGPGDDMAVVACGGEQLLVTTDQVLDGVHFVLAEHGPRAAGRKAMARSLSDVAAMAARPLAAVATVALPKGFAREGAEAIYAGLRALGDELDCPLVGGDVGSWAGALAITVTILARPGPTPPVLRSGAEAGDAICVTGSLGGAWRTTRHLTFTPRIAEALTLAEKFDLHAMIDLSDGLSVDLGHVCEASGVAAEVAAADLPVHADASGAPDPLAAALNDGEDYELLFTLAPAEAERLLRGQPLDVRVARVGTVVEGRGCALVHPDGRRERLEPGGWEHRT
jgi:thiamine-monophosphate kinase